MRISGIPKHCMQHTSYSRRTNSALSVACHVPGHSAYNTVERCMAPLSHDLLGLILPHDHYVSHLDSNSKTVDSDLEKANFKKAGETLAEVWNQTVIDDYSVHAKYVEPEVSSNAAHLPFSSQQ